MMKNRIREGHTDTSTKYFQHLGFTKYWATYLEEQVENKAFHMRTKVGDTHRGVFDTPRILKMVKADATEAAEAMLELISNGNRTTFMTHTETLKCKKKKLMGLEPELMKKHWWLEKEFIDPKGPCSDMAAPRIIDLIN